MKTIYKIYYQSRYKDKEFNEYQTSIFENYGIDHQRAVQKLCKLELSTGITITKDLAHSEHQTFFLVYQK